MALVFGMFATIGSAQDNIAPKATTSGQGSGGVTPYLWNWQNINNGNYGSCGSQQAFIWTSSPPNGSEWMQWTWKRSYIIKEIVIYHAQTTGRFLASGTVQRWNGTKWVDHHKFKCSQSNCVNTITFDSLLVGDRLRITDWTAGTGQTSNMNYREIEIWTAPSGFDAGVTALVKPANPCNYTQDVAITFANLGKERIDSVTINWELDGVAQTGVDWNKGSSYNISDTITQGKSVNITLATNVSLTQDTKYRIKAWSTMPNGKQDTVPITDTLNYVFDFLGSPKDPQVKDVRHCGIGSVPLVATPGSSKDQILWFDARNGGNIVATGASAMSPFLTRSDSFFAQANKLTTNVFQNAFNGGTIVTANTSVENGGFWNFSIGSNPIILDSLTVRLWQNYAGSSYKLYYREGGFNGEERNPTSWTLVKQGNGKVINRECTVEGLDLLLNANTTYGFYFSTDPNGTGNDIYLNSGNAIASNNEVSIQGGSCCQGLFGSIGVYNTWTQDVRIGYRKAACQSNRVRLDVEIVPTPDGSSITKGSSFNGVFNSGGQTDPDFIAEMRTGNYELTSPRKYSNSDFGTKWTIAAFSMGTVNGTPIPTGDTTMSLPSSGGNGKLSYTPSQGWEDSTIRIEVQLYDLIENCDSTVERYIYVAPTPHPNFEGGNACLGTPIELTNKTTILKGYVSYFWDFGDGTTADFETPVKDYKAPGTYNVKLTATSELGISKDTTIQITVYEIPDIDFTVRNNCEGVDVVFTNHTTISKGSIDYKWTFGDGNTSKLESPTHLYTNPGGYKVHLVATANGCKSELTKNAFQFARPDASFTVEGKCSGQPVKVTNTSTIAIGEYGTFWSFGGGEYGTLTEDEYTFSDGGNKTIKMKAISEFGCTDSAEQDVAIEQAPVADFSYGPLCDVDPVDFTNLTTEPTGISTIYEWDFGDGNTSTQTNPTHDYAKFGPVTITLKATGSNGCFTTKSVDDRVLIQPIAEFEVGDGCEGEPISFINKSKVSAGNINYRWDFGDEDSSFDNSPRKIYDNNGETFTYVATLTASVEGGCSDEYSQSVTVGEQPTCAFTAEVSETDRTMWTFTPANTSYGQDAYTWVFEGSGLSTDVTPTHTFDYEDNKYRVILRVLTGEGCECIDSTHYITTSWNLGVDGAKELDGVKVFPNPTTGLVFIQMDIWSGNDKGSIEILDVTGREVRTVEISDAKTAIDLSDLAKGMYTIRVSNLTQQATRTTQIRLQ